MVGGIVVCSAIHASALAQTSATPVTTQSDPDVTLVPSEPDFTLSSLPTTLRLPEHKLAFRLTHRFTRSIGDGTVGDFFANFFEFDSSARVGLELRYGLARGTEVVVHRTSEREIQMLGRHEFVGQSGRRPVTVDGILAVNGLNNFSKNFSVTVALPVSHRVGDHAALYVEPMAVSDSNIDRFASPIRDTTFMLGLGTRIRLGHSRSYLVFEGVPRFTGTRDGVSHVSIAIEKRAGGHVFQFNISNSLATTFRGLAHGGPDSSDWFVGFSLTRRFF